MRMAIRYALVALVLIIIVILINLLNFLRSPPSTLQQYSPIHRGFTRVDVQQDRLQGRLYKTKTYRAPIDLIPNTLRQVSALPVTVTAAEFRSQPGVKTGNPLIDEYGNNDVFLSGEMGRGLTFVGKEKKAADALLEEFNLNVMASDLVPLNRLVPDSRMDGCANLTYDTDLPTATVIIPFYDEWPSVLLRTVYSIVNRTPRHLLQEILLVDDHSTLDELKEPLDQYISDHFPRDLVRVLHVPRREGLIQARMRGWQESKGEVVVFFDSHMEVNIDWLQPLLTEIKKDRRAVTMSVLDYVNKDTLNYWYDENDLLRYCFDWSMVFFGTSFRPDQIGPIPQRPRPGPVMVGAGFAMDRNYFGELGGYDTGMKIWGGENLEMAWRVWMCGGRLVHVPCSHVGHIERGQPYSFPQGRHQIELFNYKRAVMVWMDEQKEFVFNHFPDMKDVDVGDLSERYALRDRLQCHNFTWYLDKVWPELNVYNRDVIAWGSLVNKQKKNCLDNHNFLYHELTDLFVHPCHFKYHSQGFSLTKKGWLRTTLQCVVFKHTTPGERPKLEDCIRGTHDQWNHTQEGRMVHVASQLCLDEDEQGPVMMTCSADKQSQLWSFSKSAV